MSSDRILRLEHFLTDTINRVSRIRDTHTVLFEVQSVEDDYVVCRKYDPKQETVKTIDVAVAKPWHVRVSTWDGETLTYAGGQTIDYTRTSERKRAADDGTTSHNQVLTPEYVIGEIIPAIQIVTGVNDTSGNPVKWLDQSVRLWAQET